MVQLELGHLRVRVIKELLEGLAIAETALLDLAEVRLVRGAALAAITVLSD